MKIAHPRDASNTLRVSMRDSRLNTPVMDDATSAVKDARIVIMNPPFTNRKKMGHKFDARTQGRLRERMDQLESFLEIADSGLSEFLIKNSLRPHFVALADLSLDRSASVLTKITPSTATSSTSGLAERRLLADRFHVHTILTVRGAGDINLSQDTALSESIIVLKRHTGTTKPDTRIVTLDRLPSSHTETQELCERLCEAHPLTRCAIRGWGEVSFWPVERISAGDWSAAVWRSPDLAEAAYEYAQSDVLSPLESVGLSGHSTGQQLSGQYRRSTVGDERTFPVCYSKSAEAQTRIELEPDEEWAWKQPGEPPILAKRGCLLVTAGQRTSTARLVAIAGEPCVGAGWMPVTGVDRSEAQALAVFINSTIGRIMLMSRGSRAISFPQYKVAVVNQLPIPNIHDPRITQPLAESWQATRNLIVPQFRDGYTLVRRKWDEAVCSALGWDFDEISRLGKLLHAEPHVRGVAQGQWRA